MGEGRRKESRDRFWSSPYGGRGYGIGYPRPYLFPGEGLSSSQTFVTEYKSIFCINLSRVLRKIDGKFMRNSWDSVSENVDLT